MEGAVDELLGSPLVFPDATNTGISAVMTTTEPLNSLKKKTVVVCTAEHDELIREGIELYAKEGMPNWNAVGKHSGLTGDQASKRWSRNLNPALAMRKKGPWSEEEVDVLRELVESTPKRVSGGHAGKMDWTAISAAIIRTERDCQDKWKRITTKRPISSTSSCSDATEEEVALAANFKLQPKRRTLAACELDSNRLDGCTHEPMYQFRFRRPDGKQSSCMMKCIICGIREPKLRCVQCNVGLCPVSIEHPNQLSCWRKFHTKMNLV